MEILKKLKDVFNSIFKKSDNQKVKDTHQLPESPYKISYNPMGDLQDGTFQVELKNNDTFNQKPYNTTFIDICNEPIMVGNNPLYKCGLSWYNDRDSDGDTMFCDPENPAHILAQENVLVGINWTLLQQDPNYCIALLEKLCDKPCVEEYLGQGLQEEPKRPCGNYIGSIKKTDKGVYTKYFDELIGKAVHNSPSMVTKRTTYKQSIEDKKQQEILSKQEEIAKLQNELQNLER